VKSNPSTIQRTASQRENQAVPSPSKNETAGQKSAAVPKPERAKDGPGPDGASSAKIVRAAQSKPAKKVSGRSRASTAKKISKARSIGRSPRKVAAGSKQDSVIALLRQPQGATIDRLVKVTGWQPHSVRGFLAGTVRKKLKLQLQSQKIDGRRTYHIKSGKVAAKTGKPRAV
jgi:Protein of unknown function (DUF3489)